MSASQRRIIKLPPRRFTPPPAPAIVAQKHPLQLCFDICQRLGKPGEWIWLTQKAWAEDEEAPWNVEQRLAYLKKAIANQRRRLSEGGLDRWRHIPVDIETFIASPNLMNKRTAVWPEVMPYLEAINDGTRSECVLTGGIGVAKTTIALYTQSFQIYLLSAMVSPHKEFDLDPSSEILTVFQSLSKNLAQDVDYKRFRDMVGNAPYFEEHFPFNKDRESEMTFPRRIQVKPVAGHDQAAIGQNVIGGILDEINFMAVVEKSKMTHDSSVYDQAVSNYNAIASRRESRFMKQGEVPGMLCLVSSRNYPGQFTDTKEKEAKTNPRIYVYDKVLWDLRPHRFSGERFRIFVGDDTRRPRILGPHETPSERDRLLIKEIPVEYKKRFEADILVSMREVAGVSTLAMHPFIPDTTAVSECFHASQFSIISRDVCDFGDRRLEIYPKRFIHPSEPRFAHGDIGITGDGYGLAVGHVPGFKSIQRSETVTELMPIIYYDLILRIEPMPNSEIELENPRRLLYKLRELGLNIKWATFDSYQSIDGLQLLRQRGFIVGQQSMDERPTAYDVTKQAFYDRRIRAHLHPTAQTELARLERDPKTRKIDHPPHGSKDCADAMAGVCYGLTMRRDVWRRHGISLRQIPQSLIESEQAGKVSVNAAEARAQFNQGYSDIGVG